MPAGVVPTAERETALLSSGYRLIAGIDEAGRGCLAGPVVAAAVILPTEILRAPAVLADVRDSKQLTCAHRDRLRPIIEREAIAWGIGVMPNELIDAIGIAAATRLAMAAAIADLNLRPDYLLIDFVRIPAVELPQEGIIDGDALCLSIAAASILAKTERDALMCRAELDYPGYAFAEHKGYGTRAHLSALDRLGPCPLHRRSFAPIRQSIGA